MNKKTVAVSVLVLLGVYFLLFHTAPFPLNHEAIGLPPFHTVHAIFGVVLLGAAAFVWKKK
ncbi:MAG: hypothetical protein AAB960_01430 [Patescibacteria group bacterium]